MSFKIDRQLGQDGAQGVVSLVTLDNGQKCAMKQFKSSKSSKRIRVEANFQRRAALAGISPKVLFVDEENKRIFMEPMMGGRLIDVDKISIEQQETIV